MSIIIKTTEEIEKMRVAGRLAAEVLDYIEPFVKPGVTTAELGKMLPEYYSLRGWTPEGVPTAATRSRLGL